MRNSRKAVGVFLYTALQRVPTMSISIERFSNLGSITCTSVFISPLLMCKRSMGNWPDTKGYITRKSNTPLSMPKAQEFGMHKATEAHSCIVFRCKLLGVNAGFDLTTFSNVRAVSRRTFQAAPEEPGSLIRKEAPF